MAGGPDRPGGALRRPFFSIFQNGVQNGVQKWGPKKGSKMGSNNGVQQMGSKMGQLPSLRAATTTSKNEKSPLSVSSGSGWGPLGGGEGEGGKLEAAVKSHSLVAPRGGWRIPSTVGERPPVILTCSEMVLGVRRGGGPGPSLLD